MTIPIQLAIQGGGAKITHLLAALEAVQSLERQKVLRVTRIAGTSAGAIAGALYAARVDMQRARDAFVSHRDELLRAFPATSAPRAAWCVLTRRPFWNAAPLRRLLATFLAPREHVGDLDIPLIIVASDLTNRERCVYADPREPLLSSLMDSAGIPFFLRTGATDGSRTIVDGGICENLPSDQLSYGDDLGEIVGITFAKQRSGAPLDGFASFAQALMETALDASVRRAQLELGPNNFAIRTEAGSFDFARAFTFGLEGEYRETRLLAADFFRRYVERATKKETRSHTPSPQTELPATRLQDMIASLRSMYRWQHEPVRFEFLSVTMVVTGASQAGAGESDHVCYEIVFRPATQPIHCYRIRLPFASAAPLRTECEVFDRNYEPVPFDLVSITGDASEEREYLLFFRKPIQPGDPRTPVTLRLRDTVPDALRLIRDDHDELLTRVSRADRPIHSVEIVVHLPEALRATTIAPAPGSDGAAMTSAELRRFAAPAGFYSLGWKGRRVPPDTHFGCHLTRRKEAAS